MHINKLFEQSAKKVFLWRKKCLSLAFSNADNVVYEQLNWISVEITEKKVHRKREMRRLQRLRPTVCSCVREKGHKIEKIPVSVIKCDAEKVQVLKGSKPPTVPSAILNSSDALILCVHAILLWSLLYRILSLCVAYGFFLLGMVSVCVWVNARCAWSLFFRWLTRLRSIFSSNFLQISPSHSCCHISNTWRLCSIESQMFCCHSVNQWTEKSCREATRSWSNIGIGGSLLESSAIRFGIKFSACHC